MNTRSSSHPLRPAFALPPSLRAAGTAIVLMVVASALFALQGALVKIGLRDLSPLELVFFRGLICAVAIFAFARSRGLGLTTARPIAQIGLGIAGFTSLALYFVSIGLLPLVTATALNYTAPLFLALGLYIFRRHSARSASVLWAAGGLVGAWLILKPSLAEESTAGVALGLLSGATGAIAYLLLSRLARSGEPDRVTAFYFSVVVCVLAGVPTLFVGFSIATWQQLGLVLAIGVLATVAQLAIGRAYALASPIIPAAFSYSTVVFSSLLGAWWWGDQLGYVEMAGIALIVASGVLVSVGQAAERVGEQAAERNESAPRRDYRGKNLKSLYAAIRLALDPNRTEYVFMMGSAQDDIAESERSQGRIRDPFATVPALEGMWQSKFDSECYDVDALMRLSPDSLGGAYARHMKANGLRPDYYTSAVPRHRQHYLRLRINQTHDIWHVLTGFGTDEFGEVGLQGFYFAQFTSGQAAIIGAGAMLKSVLRGRLSDLERHVDAFCEGYCRGKRATSLLEVKWEDLWGESLDSLRARFGIDVAHFHVTAPLAQRAPAAIT